MHAPSGVCRPLDLCMSVCLHVRVHPSGSACVYTGLLCVHELCVHAGSWVRRPLNLCTRACVCMWVCVPVHACKRMRVFYVCLHHAYLFVVLHVAVHPCTRESAHMWQRHMWQV